MQNTALNLTNTSHATLFTLLVLTAATVQAQDGTWTNLVNGDASGSWSTAANWNNNVIAGGAGNTADFSSLDLTTNSTVTLDGARTIGHILFGDTTPDANWAITTGTAGPLSLDVTTGSPTVTANSGSNTIAAVVASGTGLTKSGPGTLQLSAANPNLSNLVVVAAGILQAGNASAFGPIGNHTMPDRVINTDGGTVQVMAGLHVNNKHLTLAGAGVDGTRGALYAVPGNNNSTRWGLNSWNGSSSPNSSAAFPAVSFPGDATIRVDGDWAAQPASAFLVGYVFGTNSTLTKTGGGRLSFDRGLNGITSLLVQAGAYMPNSAGAFGSIQSYVVASNAAIVNNQGNNCFSTTANIQLAPGAFFDINWRGNGTVGSDTASYTQNIGYLNGAGVLTTGSRGNTAVQTLVINGADSNSVFNGTITVSNGTFRITKNGSNTLTLNGNNNYNGLTTLNSGTLVLNGTNSGTGGYVLSGGVLAGGGTIAAAITNNGAIIQAGDPASPGGTLTVLSNIIGSSFDTISISNANLAVGGYIGPNFQLVGTLYMTNGTLELPLRTLGPSASVSALTVDGKATIKFSMATPLLGQFPIVSYNSLGGLAGFSGLSLVSPPGISATLSNNTSTFTLDVVIRSIPALTWTGVPDGNWDIGSVNWQGVVAYTQPGGFGPFVVFDDTAPGTTAVTLATTLTPQGVTVNNSTLNYTFSGSGKLSGSTGIAKQGTGTLTVVNSGNDFAGGVNLSQGTVQVGNGGTTGDLGSGPIANLGTLALNRSDSFTLVNTVSGNGNITKAGAGTVTVPVSGDSSGLVTVNGGTLALAPAGTSKFSGGVSGSGAFGVNGAGTLILNGFNNAWAGGTVVASGTLQFGDETGSGVAPPAGNITDNGTLATTLFGILPNNISGTGGVSLLNSVDVTLSGANTYAGPTVVLGGSVTAATASWPAGSALVLGSQNGGPQSGSAHFTSGNPVLGGLRAGGSSTPDTVYLDGGNQAITVNGNLIVGNTGPSGVVVSLGVVGTGASLTVVTNGGTIQLGLGNAGSGVNPDSVTVDFSSLDQFVVDLGATGVVNLGTLDGNPGPSAGATVPNVLKLSGSSNLISAGTITIGAGGRQLIPELRLGAGTNLLNTGALRIGGGGRDGGALLFDGATGGVRVRAYDGVSRAVLNEGDNPGTGTGASITNTVNLAGHPADLLLSQLVIGNYNNAGIYENTFSFDQGVLDTLSTRLSVLRNNNNNAASSSSTLNIAGGTATLGPVSLTASAAAGTLNITGGNVTVTGITDPGAGVSTLNVSGAALNVDIPGFGNPSAAPIAVDVFSASGTVHLGVNGLGFAVGQFPLIKYTGAIGGTGFPALTLTSLPAGVAGSLSNYVANQSVDLVITAAPPAVNPFPTNLVFSVAGGQLDLSWPADRIGWLLQSNSVSIVSANSWFGVLGSTTTNHMIVPIDAAKTSVFFRLRAP